MSKSRMPPMIKRIRPIRYIFSPFVGKKGVIRVKKKSDLGRKIMGAIYSKKLRVLT